MARKFAPAQIRYMAAKAAFDVAYNASRKHDALMDAEGEKLGLDVPYCILPDGHPMRGTAQALLDTENAARKTFYAACTDLFDWALDATFARMGSPAQKRDIRASFETIKKMAHVEKFHTDAVAICMKLAA